MLLFKFCQFLFAKIEYRYFENVQLIRQTRNIKSNQILLHLVAQQNKRCYAANANISCCKICWLIAVWKQLYTGKCFAQDLKKISWASCLALHNGYRLSFLWSKFITGGSNFLCVPLFWCPTLQISPLLFTISQPKTYNVCSICTVEMVRSVEEEWLCGDCI